MFFHFDAAAPVDVAAAGPAVVVVTNLLMHCTLL